MFAALKSLLSRTSPTLFEDVLGVTSLFVVLFVGLTLSGAT